MESLRRFVIDVKKAWADKAVARYGLEVEIVVWATLYALGWHEGTPVSAKMLQQARDKIWGAFVDWDL